MIDDGVGNFSCQPGKECKARPAKSQDLEAFLDVIDVFVYIVIYIYIPTYIYLPR